MLLDAKCDPNILGAVHQSPLLYAVGVQNKEAVEDLLIIAGADVNYAPAGFKPPLCVAIRHRMGDIAKTLLTYKADITVRGHPPCGSIATDSNPGPTVTELASDDRVLHSLLRAHQTSHTARRGIEEID